MAASCSIDRHNFISDSGNRLVGELSNADADRVVVFAHGFSGEKSMRGRFDFQRDRLVEKGYAVFAFDFSGCGESSGECESFEQQRTDLRSAVDFLKTKGYARFAFYGHSLGSGICLLAASNEVETMVLSGAFVAPMRYEWKDYYSPEQMGSMRESWKFEDDAPSRSSGVRVIHKRFLDDFANFDTALAQRRATAPALFIHGNDPQDWEEAELLANTKKVLEFFPKGSKIAVVEGADHRFGSHQRELSTLLVDWLSEHFPAR